MRVCVTGGTLAVFCEGNGITFMPWTHYLCLVPESEEIKPSPSVTMRMAGEICAAAT